MDCCEWYCRLSEGSFIAQVSFIIGHDAKFTQDCKAVMAGEFKPGVANDLAKAVPLHYTLGG
jgi:hypothetical protein